MLPWLPSSQMAHMLKDECKFYAIIDGSVSQLDSAVCHLLLL